MFVKITADWENDDEGTNGEWEKIISFNDYEDIMFDGNNGLLDYVDNLPENAGRTMTGIGATPLGAYHTLVLQIADQLREEEVSNKELFTEKQIKAMTDEYLTAWMEDSNFADDVLIEMKGRR